MFQLIFFNSEGVRINQIMRKDSVIIFGISLLITTLIVGGAYYLTFKNPAAEETSGMESLPKPATPVVKQPIPSRNTNPILKCHDPELGEFYTNASSCDEADLENTISHAESITPSRAVKDSTLSSRSSAHKVQKREDEPDIRRVAKNVPPGLSVSCKFSVGKALEVERVLSASDDPAESIWVENYCKWVKESRAEKCEIEIDFFYYRHLCPL